MIAIAIAEFDDDSPRGVTLEWIQSLSPELKDAALYRFCRTAESKPTLVESFTLNQVIYRTISGGTFTESADNVAARTGCDRKTILKGLSLAVSQNILEENKRPGTSNEYSFKPVEEWLPEPVVRITDIRTKKFLEFPTIQNNNSVEDEEQISSNREVVRIMDYPETEQQLHSNDGVVRVADDHETDANNNIVVVNKILNKQQQLVSVPVEDIPKSSHWKYVGQGLPRVYLPPELDSDTGMKIESIHVSTKEPRQFIIKRAVELLYDSMNKIPSVAVESRRSVSVPPVVIPSVVQKSNDIPTDEALANAMRELRRLRIEDNTTVRSMVKRLWGNFQGAHESIKQRMERGEPFVNITGAFVNALKNGDQPEVAVIVEQVAATNIDEPTAQEMALIDEAIATGRAKGKYCGSLGWLVIENNGHVAPWQQFLTLMQEGNR